MKFSRIASEDGGSRVELAHCLLGGSECPGPGEIQFRDEDDVRTLDLGRDDFTHMSIVQPRGLCFGIDKDDNGVWGECRFQPGEVHYPIGQGDATRLDYNMIKALWILHEA